jgi:uncharacterized SAM-binding protein YcdF (DUF218 family)
VFWWDDPIFFILILLAAALFFRQRWLGRIIVGLFAVVSLTPLSMWLLSSLEGPILSSHIDSTPSISSTPLSPSSSSVHSPPSAASSPSDHSPSLRHSPITVPSPTKRRAIVVLTGGTVHYYPSLDRYEAYWAVDRITEAIRLFKKGAAPTLLLTGTERKPEHSEREVESMVRFAKEWGVPESAIVLEDKARNTFENAENVARVLKEKGITDFYLVTSAFHMKRAMLCFQKQGLTPVPFPVDYSGIPGGWKNWIVTPGRKWFFLSVFMHETIGLVWYWINGRV